MWVSCIVTLNGALRGVNVDWGRERSAAHGGLEGRAGLAGPMPEGDGAKRRAGVPPKSSGDPPEASVGAPLPD